METEYLQPNLDTDLQQSVVELYDKLTNSLLSEAPTGHPIVQLIDPYKNTLIFYFAGITSGVYMLADPVLELALYNLFN